MSIYNVRITKLMNYNTYMCLIDVMLKLKVITKAEWYRLETEAMIKLL